MCAVNRCGHCEARPAATPYGLCTQCDAVKRVRRLYVPPARLDPLDPQVRYCREREAQLRHRANQRLPLFPPTRN
jgi:hypothetical protein